MKYILTSLIMVFTLQATPQIQMKKPIEQTTIGEVRQGGFKAKLTKSFVEEDTLYIITYKNERYSSLLDLQSIMFENIDGAVDELYKALASFFSPENEKNKTYKLSFQLGDQDILVNNYRVLGETWARISTDDGYFHLNKKQLDQLFGR